MLTENRIMFECRPQCCSKAMDLKVEAKDFKIISRPRTRKPRTCKSSQGQLAFFRFQFEISKCCG